MARQNRLLYLLVLIKLVTPFFLYNSYYQPHRDEFLYLAEGHHLAWGYMEVPPLLGVFAWLTNFLGDSLFWIKLWPAIFGALTFLLVGKIILSLGGKAFALLLGWLPFMLDGYMRLFFLFQPNFLEVFFWTMIAFSLIRHTQTGRNGWLYVFGLALGLGMMSKYSVSFYALSIFVGLLLSRERIVFTNKHFYFACLLAFLIFLPNLFWQYNHRFPVVTHMRELQEQQLQFVNPVDFIISQFFLNLPCVLTWIAGILFLAIDRAGRPFRFAGWAYFSVIVLLTVLHGKDYYALGAYPVLFAFGAVYLEKLTGSGYKWTRYLMLAFSIGLGLFGMPLIMPVSKPEQLARYYKETGLQKMLKWEDQQTHPLPQDFADMIGWKEMAMEAGQIYNQLPEEERKKTMVYCRSYGSAGALNFYRREAGLPEVYSDNASFLLWMPEKYDINNLLLVGHNIPDKDDLVFQQFKSMTVIDSMNMPLFRETGMKFILFRDANDSLKQIIEKGVAGLKSKFNR